MIFLIGLNKYNTALNLKNYNAYKFTCMFSFDLKLSKFFL